MIGRIPEDQSYKPYDPPPVHQSSTAIHNLTPKHSADATVKQGVLHLFLHNIYHQTASYNKTFLLMSTNPSSLTGKKQGGSYHKQAPAAAAAVTIPLRSFFLLSFTLSAPFCQVLLLYVMFAIFTSLYHSLLPVICLYIILKKCGYFFKSIVK